MASYRPEPTIEHFGDQLIASGDLDPLYIALTGAKLDIDQLKRFLFAYWCCYDAGASCFISEDYGLGFWELMRQMATNFPQTPLGGRWPRGHERRHFRGEKAIKAVAEYRKSFDRPEAMVHWMVYGHGPSAFDPAPILFSEVRTRVMKLPQFGPWIAFKVADMAERVLSAPIRFNDGDVMMFDSPYESALETAKLWASNQGEIRKDQELRIVREVAQTLIKSFSEKLAPPKNDRPINIQEVETILCKWKSHLNGHYPLGLDTNEIRHGLTEWSRVSQTAGKLLAAMP